MNFAPYQDNSPRLPVVFIAACLAVYLLTGITGHDPWKTEDAIHLGIAYSFVTQGQWLAPAVAGEPWPHTAPLYHWVAALLGKALGGWLPFHDAARLATSAFGALFLMAVAATAHSLLGAAASRMAPLLVIGTLGLLLPMHEAQPAVAGLAFAAMAWWGGALCLEGRKTGFIPLGVGLGLAFMAHGLVGLLMAVAALSGPLFRKDWASLAGALLIAIPLGLTWPWLLAQVQPEFWTHWWHNELAEATRARGLPQPHHLKQLIWAAWPILPLAAWGVWLKRREIDKLWLPLIGLAIATVWFFSGPARSLAVLPVLLPLIFIAAAGADRLRRGAANAFDWFALITFTCIAVLIWLGASAQALQWPARIASNLTKLAPGHEPDFGWPSLGLAGVATLAWGLSWGLRKASWRPGLRWATGVIVMWALASQLLLPLIDYAISDRTVVASLRAALPENIGCIERVGISPAQRMSMDYFAGIRTVEVSQRSRCAWRLSVSERGRTAPEGWAEVWQGGRASDRKERWYLDRRAE